MHRPKRNVNFVPRIRSISNGESNQAKKTTKESIMLNRLNESEILLGLKNLDHWHLDVEKVCIQKDFQFDSFKAALRFISHLGELADAIDHHPEFTSNYTKLKIILTTHDVNGLTEKDFALAKQIDQLSSNE